MHSLSNAYQTDLEVVEVSITASIHLVKESMINKIAFTLVPRSWGKQNKSTCTTKKGLPGFLIAKCPGGYKNFGLSAWHTKQDFTNFFMSLDIESQKNCCIIKRIVLSILACPEI